jgi:MATE family multidrug resistance protein
MGMETASFSLTAVMVGWIGTTALAAHQVMLTVGQLGFMMYYGMAAAVAVLASNYHGRNDLESV